MIMKDGLNGDVLIEKGIVIKNAEVEEISNLLKKGSLNSKHQ